MFRLAYFATMTSSVAAAPSLTVSIDEPPGSSDEALMLAYAGGDARAFDRLYERHRGPLFRYLQRQCGGRSHAEELFQEVWMALIGARERYSVNAKFTTYLYTLARHRVIDHFRRQGVRLQVVEQRSDEYLDCVPAGGPGPDAQLDATRNVNQVLALVDALPPAQREVMLLRSEEGLSIDEIAQITSTERETVKSRLRYALDKLRRGMEGRL